MASKNIKILISTFLDSIGLSKASVGIEKLKGAVRKASSQMATFFGGVGRNLMNIKAGIDLAVSAFRLFNSALSKGFEFERLTTQFKTLTGSIEDAKVHMKELQDLGRTPPFSLEEFASASAMMMKMSGGIIGFKEDLKIVGDMAAATGSDITAVGRAFALTYQVVRDGQDFGRAGQQLYMMGIMTKKQVAYFNDLIKSGRSNAEVWEEIKAVFDRYSGAMAETAKTTKGLKDAISGELDVAMTNFSTSLSEAASPALQELLDYLVRINEDGTIDVWADRCVTALTRVSDGVKAVIPGLAKLLGGAWDAIKFGWEAQGQAIGNAYGTLVGGGSVIDAAKAAAEGVKTAYDEIYNEDEREAELREMKKAEIAEKRIAREEKAKKAEEERKRKRDEEMQKAEEERLRQEAEAERTHLEEREKFEAELNRKKLEEEKKAEEEARKAKEERDAVEHKAKIDFEKDRLNAEKKSMNEAHRIKMKLLAQEKAAYDEQIEKLKQIGAANPFRMAANLDQAADLRALRQEKIDEGRFKRAKDSLETKMRKAGIDPNGNLEDVSKLGRLSNLEQAALERMRLDRATDEANDVQQKMLDAEVEMKGKMESIDAKLSALGLN